MKRKFLNSMLCMILAGSMLIGDAGTALAAGITPETEKTAQEISENLEPSQVPEKPMEDPTEVPEDTAEVPKDTAEVTEDTTEVPKDTTEVSEDTTEVSEDTTEIPEDTAEVTRDSVTQEEASEEKTTEKEPEADSMNLEAAASEIPAYTPVLSTMDVYWGSMSSEWVTVTWKGTGWRFDIIVNGEHEISEYNKGNENEEMSGRHTFPTNLETVYKIEIIPYSYSGKKGASKTMVKKREFGTVTNFTGKRNSVEDEIEKEYYKPGIILDWKYDGPARVEYEIMRSTNRDSGYSTIAFVTDKQYKDNGLLPGTYYYKIKLRSKTYMLPEVVPGPISQPVKVEVDKVSAQCTASLDERGRVVVKCSADRLYVYGFEIYRSSQRNSGYRKITTTSDDTYIDYEAQKGKTYYYKVRGFYYHTKNKKTYLGDYSNPQGITVVKDDFVIEKANAISTSKAYLRWSKVSGADEYRIYYKSANAGDRFKLLTSTKKNAYTKSGLTSGQTYYFQIYAYRKKKEYAVTDIVPVMVGLAAPQNLMVSGRTYAYSGDTYIIKNKLTWDRVYGADGYYLQVNNGNWETVQKLSSSRTSCTYNQLVKSMSDRDIKVRLVAYKGSTQYKGEILELPLKFEFIKGVKVKQKGTDSAVITWNRSVGAKLYTVYRLLPNGDYVWVGSTEGTTLTDTGLKEGINYTYWVRIRELYNGTEYVGYIPSIRDTGDFKEFALYIPKPSITSAKNTKAGQATIKWRKTSGAQRYDIYRSESKSGTYKKIKSVNARTTSYTDSNLKEGRYYYYKVRSCKVNRIRGEVYSGYSSYKGVKVAFSVPKPSISAVKNKSKYKAVISWKKVRTAKGYEIYRSNSKKGTYKRIKTVSSKTASYTNSKLKKGKTYYYKIRAYRINSSKKKVYSDYSSYKAVKIKK